MVVSALLLSSRLAPGVPLGGTDGPACLLGLLTGRVVVAAAVVLCLGLGGLRIEVFLVSCPTLARLMEKSLSVFLVGLLCFFLASGAGSPS